jgi:hypothetical protein
VSKRRSKPNRVSKANPYRSGSPDYAERTREHRRTEGALTVITIGTPAPRP